MCTVFHCQAICMRLTVHGCVHLRAGVCGRGRTRGECWWSQEIGAPVLFATHFHELTSLSGPAGVCNQHVQTAIDSATGKLTMLYQVPAPPPPTLPPSPCDTACHVGASFEKLHRFNQVSQTEEFTAVHTAAQVLSRSCNAVITEEKRQHKHETSL